MTLKILLAMTIGLIFAVNAVDWQRQEIEKLKGSWVCVSAVSNGKTLSEQTVKKLRLTLSESGYKTEKGDEVLFESTYSIDINKQPAWIDIVGTEGELKGKIAQGIYVLEDGRLKICYTMPEGKRPTAFESAVGSGASLAVWLRAPAP